MRVRSLGLADWRNYRDEQVEFASGLNLITGRNAQGKTNLLEAVHFLGGLGSPRGLDAVLVREGAERAVLHAEIERGGRALRMDLEVRPGQGIRVLLNGTPVSGPRALTEVVATVFFGPDEMSLVKGPPDGRRRFLDDLVVKLRPARYGLRREWDRVLRQRNALLKSAPRGAPGRTLETLEVWDEAFCTAGAALTEARLDALAALRPYAAKRYEEVAGVGRLELGYDSTWLSSQAAREALNAETALSQAELKDALAARIDEVRSRELERGMSLAGPQRDDVRVGLAGPDGGAELDARSYASQGDQRTAALALKLAEHDLVADALGDQPILLLDDVLSELDPGRRAWLADTIRPTEQTIMTSAEPGAVEAVAPERTLTVDGGRVSDDRS